MSFRRFIFAPRFRPHFQQGNSRSEVCGVCYHGWLGVRHATEGNFANWVAIDHCKRAADADRIAAEIVERGWRKIFLNGYPHGGAHLVRRLRSRGAEVSVVYHGAPTQHFFPAEREAFDEIVALHRERIVERIYFVKPGLHGLFGELGLRTGYLPNRFRTHLADAAPPRLDGREIDYPANVAKVGLFTKADLDWTKNTPNQFLAATSLPNVRVYGNFDAALLGYAAEWRSRYICLGMLAHGALLGVMARMDALLYVTLGEACPLVVMESMQRGVPVLTADNHGLFDGNDGLRRALIVSKFDSAGHIREQLQAVLANRSSIARELLHHTAQLREKIEARWVRELGTDVF